MFRIPGHDTNASIWYKINECLAECFGFRYVEVQDFLIAVLVGFSNLFAVNPADLSPQWNIDKYWTKENQVWVLEASSSSISKKCEAGKFLEFPQVIHGVHSVWIDGKLVLRSGDPTFQKASSFYARPSLSCVLIPAGAVIRWQVISYSEFFAKIKEMPSVRSEDKVVISNLFDVTLNLTSAAVVFLFLLLSMFLFAGKISRQYFVLLITGGVSFIVYSLVVVADKVGLNIGMLAAHRIADVAVWTGATSYFYFFMIRDFISVRLFRIFLVFLFFSFLLLLFGKNADLVQFGTIFPMPIAFIFLTTFLAKLIGNYLVSHDKMARLEFLSALLFIAVSMNDLLNILNIVDGYMMLPLASIIVFFHIAAIVNTKIEESFQQNERMMNELKSQHMLEQIAHDIRSPLSVLNLLIPAFVKDPNADKADLLQQASGKISAIAQSLFEKKNNSYIHDLPFCVFDVVNKLLREKELELSSSNLIILSIDPDYDKNARIKTNELEFVRMISNLINNSVSAVRDSAQPKIEILLGEDRNNIVVEVTDNGKGIPPEILSEVGKRGFSFGKRNESNAGSGLGLFHAKTFVKMNHGSFAINSTYGSGSAIKIMLSKYHAS